MAPDGKFAYVTDTVNTVWVIEARGKIPAAGRALVGAANGRGRSADPLLCNVSVPATSDLVRSPGSSNSDITKSDAGALSVQCIHINQLASWENGSLRFGAALNSGIRRYEPESGGPRTPAALEEPRRRTMNVHNGDDVWNALHQ
ncbi:hypothetical protein BFN03_10230 [Rhodococcus sp. WMMA185]|nr:hypothetical protein BFN03_10230 [Rhodococcus sp. WMMA185]